LDSPVLKFSAAGNHTHRHALTHTPEYSFYILIFCMGQLILFSLKILKGNSITGICRSTMLQIYEELITTYRFICIKNLNSLL